MEIRKLFGQTESAKNAAVKKQQEELAQQSSTGAEGAVAKVAGEDVVSLSSLSRQLLKVSDIVQEDNKARENRVAELKRKVEDGSYSVDSSDVARSLISFASELPAQRDV